MRKNIHQYLMDVATAVGERGTCDRGHVGTVIASLSGRILSTGYAGSPSKLPHCDDIGHELITRTRENGSATQHCVRTVHAEANAIIQAARYGIKIDGSILYTTMFPCIDCSKLIINSGITAVIAKLPYSEMILSCELLISAGVGIVYLGYDTQLPIDFSHPGRGNGC